MTVSPTLKNLLQFTLITGLLSFSTLGFSFEDKITNVHPGYVAYQCPSPNAIKVTNIPTKSAGWHATGVLVTSGDNKRIELTGYSPKTVPPFARLNVAYDQSTKEYTFWCEYRRPDG